MGKKGVGPELAGLVLGDLAAGYSPAETAAFRGLSRPTVYRLRREAGLREGRKPYALGREVMAAKAERLERLAGELAQGKSQRVIAAEWKLSRQRISQLVAELRDGERRAELAREGRDG